MDIPQGGFSCPLFPGQICGGGGGGKLEGCEKNSWSMEENQKQTQPTCDTGSGNQTWTTPHPPLVGSEGPHYCAIPALIC